MLGQVKSG